MKRNPFETILGAIVLIAAIGFLGFALNKIDVEKIDGYNVKVVMNKANGLVKGADVRISGIKVGTVTDLTLDQDTFAAVATLAIKRDIRLPTDSVAAISAEGLIGGKYVKLEPGSAKEAIDFFDGYIRRVKEYKSLEDTVGELIFLATQ